MLVSLSPTSNTQSRSSPTTSTTTSTASTPSTVSFDTSLSEAQLRALRSTPRALVRAQLQSSVCSTAGVGVHVQELTCVRCEWGEPLLQARSLARGEEDEGGGVGGGEEGGEGWGGVGGRSGGWPEVVDIARVGPVAGGNLVLFLQCSLLENRSFSSQGARAVGSWLVQALKAIDHVRRAEGLHELARADFAADADLSLLQAYQEQQQQEQEEEEERARSERGGDEEDPVVRPSRVCGPHGPQRDELVRLHPDSREYEMVTRRSGAGGGVQRVRPQERRAVAAALGVLADRDDDDDE